MKAGMVVLQKLCDNDRFNASASSEESLRIKPVKFRKCGEVLYCKYFSLRLKEVHSAMLYGSKTWCLNDKEVATLRRTERNVLRAMCRVKLMDRKKNSE